MEIYYTVYKVTNQINGKVYIGCHKTRNLDDGYMGSGKYLKRSIEVHGLENFKKEILFVFDNSEDMFSKEGEIVTEDFIAEENTYNLKVGGMGGFDYINTNTSNEEKYKSIIKGNAKRSTTVKKLHKEGRYDLTNFVTAVKNKHLNGGIKYDNFKGKSHTVAARYKISSAAKLMVGKKNSQFGTMWITNGSECKKIKKEKEIPAGWYKGRIKS